MNRQEDRQPEVAGASAVPPAHSSARRVIVGPAPAANPARRRGLTPLDVSLAGLSLVVLAAIVWALTQSGSSAGNTPAGAGGTGTHVALATDANGRPLPLTAGTLAPDFTLPATDGKTYTLSQFRGHPVLLEFMAPWCPHCQVAAADLNQLNATYSPRGVQFLSVSATPLGVNGQSAITMQDLVWFHDTYTVTFPLLLDSQTTIGPDQYAVTGFPFIYVLDAQGRIFEHPGFGAADLAASLDRVLK